MNGSCKLVVAVDQVAFLRESANASEPDPIHFALSAELAGALGIRAHLRIDRKHISEQEMDSLNRMVKSQFYMQVSPHQDIVHLVNGLRPKNVILSAERRDERALENGLDVALLSKELMGIIKNIDSGQTRVFLFIEPDFDQIKAAARLGVHGVLINSRELMLELGHSPGFKKKFGLVSDAVKLSSKYKMETHLASGILAEHLPVLTAIPGVEAIHVDHQLVARSLQLGVFAAVQSFLNAM